MATVAAVGTKTASPACKYAHRTHKRCARSAKTMTATTANGRKWPTTIDAALMRSIRCACRRTIAQETRPMPKHSQISQHLYRTTTTNVDDRDNGHIVVFAFRTHCTLWNYRTVEHNIAGQASANIHKPKPHRSAQQIIILQYTLQHRE